MLAYSDNPVPEINLGRHTNTGTNEIAYRLCIRYDSKYGQHVDNTIVQKQHLSTVLDALPAVMKADLNTFEDDTSKTYDYIRGKLFNNDMEAQSIRIPQDDFIRHPGHNVDIEPLYGRFYPQTIFNSHKLSMSNKMIPVRVIGIMDKEILLNISHPLCDLNTALTIERMENTPSENTDKNMLFDARHVPDLLTGPGMQLRYGNKATDFFSENPYKRLDETEDNKFYCQPRLINHLDETALENLKHIYQSLIPPCSTILDLMSSINSHMGDKKNGQTITGLGMNEKELMNNPVLDDILLHDINQDKKLPFPDANFDVVVCSLSIEYIKQPNQLFDELARVLKHGGRLIISFSNRWFPEKAIGIWKYLHDFERMGLVMEHIIESAHFCDINTWSLRGIPRPYTDTYKTPLSDPLYVIWADRD